MTKPPRHVALAIVYDAATKRILMVTSRANPTMWILPKGGVEEGESSGQAAVREAWEEAGSPRDIPAPSDEDRLMMISLEPPGKRASVWHIHTVKTSETATEANANWLEAHERKRQWFTPTEALEKIRKWYDNPSIAEEVYHDSVIDESQSEISKKGAKKQTKRAEKGGAMEMALKAFMEKEHLS